MAPPLQLERCRTTRQWRLFERVPEILHGGDPCFVPPFPGQVMKLRIPRHPFQGDGSLAAYVALCRGRPVGRARKDCPVVQTLRGGLAAKRNCVHRTLCA